MKNDTPSPPTTSQLGGRLWKIFMGLILVIVGSVLTQYLWGSYQRAKVMDEWIETPCRIVVNSIDDSELNQRGMPKYTLVLVYEYEIDGTSYSSDRYKRLSTEASDPRKLKGKLDAYPVGKETVCYVDPEDKSIAVLRKDTKAALYSIWFPCLFVIGGLGMIATAIFRK